MAITNFDDVAVAGKRVHTRVYVPFRVNANGNIATECIFIADKPCKVASFSESHATAGTDAGAVNMQVTKDTGTAAPGAGTALLTNNTNAGVNLKGTANTVQAGTLVASAASLTLAVGDRLSIKFVGTLTALAGVSAVIGLDLV